MERSKRRAGARDKAWRDACPSPFASLRCSTSPGDLRLPTDLLAGPARRSGGHVCRSTASHRSVSSSARCFIGFQLRFKRRRMARAVLSRSATEPKSPMKKPRANAVSTEATEPDAPSRRPWREVATRLAWSLQGSGKRHAIRVKEARLGWRGEIMASKQPKHEIDARWAALPALLCAAVLLQAAGRQAPEKPEHIRGTVESLQDGVLRVATSNGSMPIRIEPSTLIDRMVRSDRAQIAEGSYLGIVSAPQADGSQRGVEVLLFSEALRGQAEGTAPWDWPGAQGGSKMTNGTASKMTNGTVSRSKMTNGTVSSQAGGSSLTLQYKNGKSAASQTIAIPSDIPVVAVEPGQLADLQTGAYVFVVATRDAGRALTAALVLAGKDGLVSRI